MKNKNQIGRINLGRIRAIKRTDSFTSSLPFPVSNKSVALSVAEAIEEFEKGVAEKRKILGLFPEQDVFSGRRYFGVVDNIGTPFMFCQSLGDAKKWQRIGIREEGCPFHIILLEVK